MRLNFHVAFIFIFAQLELNIFARGDLLDILWHGLGNKTHFRAEESNIPSWMEPPSPQNLLMLFRLRSALWPLMLYNQDAIFPGTTFVTGDQMVPVSLRNSHSENSFTNQRVFSYSDHDDKRQQNLLQYERILKESSADAMRRVIYNWLRKLKDKYYIVNQDLTSIEPQNSFTLVTMPSVNKNTPTTLSETTAKKPSTSNTFANTSCHNSRARDKKGCGINWTFSTLPTQPTTMAVTESTSTSRAPTETTTTPTAAVITAVTTVPQYLPDRSFLPDTVIRNWPLPVYRFNTNDNLVDNAHWRN